MEAMGPRAAGCVGAGSEKTMRAKAEAFQRRRTVPRMLRDVAAHDLRLGRPYIWSLALDGQPGVDAVLA